MEKNDFFVVDCDLDGDLDLVFQDGRLFEHMADGTLHEKQQNPFKPLLRELRWYEDDDMKFLDCDLDGDLDVLLVSPFEDPPVQACEHDSIAGTLRCSHDFLCLGTNLSNFRPQAGGSSQNFGKLLALDVVNASDGQLKFIAFHEQKMTAVLWSAGFCAPADPTDGCSGHGFCQKGHVNCTCSRGHELGDCSRCERHFHGVLRDVWQPRDCQPCPGENSKVCYGRGDCFDDVTAQSVQESAFAFMAAGNGSCGCYEASLSDLSRFLTF